MWFYQKKLIISNKSRCKLWKKKCRHIQTRIEHTKHFGKIEETNIYLPKSKESKLYKFGKDYSIGSTYKTTNEDGSMSYSDNENTTNNIREAKNMKNLIRRWTKTLLHYGLSTL